MKFTQEEKLKMVLDYNKSKYVPEIGIKYDTLKKHIIEWCDLYRRFGMEGLEHKPTHRSFEFKKEAVMRVVNGETITEVSRSLNVKSVSQVYVWYKKYLDGGLAALKLDRRGKNMKYSKKHKPPKINNAEYKATLKENEYLRAENAYLKKLAALVQQRKARQLKKK